MCRSIELVLSLANIAGYKDANQAPAQMKNSLWLPDFSYGNPDKKYHGKDYDYDLLLCYLHLKKNPPGHSPGGFHKHKNQMI
jgi:hypothetical protein